MARHSIRDKATGQFAKMNDSIENFINTSADDAAPELRQRYAPSADELPAEPAMQRRAVILDAQTGEHLGTVTEEALRTVIGRRNGNMPLLPGGHDSITYLTRGR